jgi:mevalonate kinase
MDLSYHSHGKLLLTGEYAVLDGALALGLPTRLGQGLVIRKQEGKKGLSWNSLDHNHNSWFETVFTTEELDPGSQDITASGVRTTLQHILREATRLNPEFINALKGTKATAIVEFPRDWGLGSSSTLINNIAQWAAVDPFALLWNAFGGSGYDIACAQSNSALLYRLKDRMPNAEPIAFNIPFKKELYLIHLNRKQSSREAIAHYKKNVANQHHFIEEISDITMAVAACTEFSEFQRLLLEHEELLSEALQIQRIQDQLFPDFSGLIKSLGAWGGDFVLAMGANGIPAYFKDKGYQTVLPYDEIVL